MRIGVEAQRVFRTKKHGMDIVILEVLHKLQQMKTADDFFVYAQPDADNEALCETGNFHIRKPVATNYASWEQRVLPKLAQTDKIELLHTTSNTGPVSLSQPLVVTLHDIIYMEQIRMRRGSAYQLVGNIYRRWNVPKIVRKAAMIITVSDYERNRILDQFKLDEKRVKTIHNACGEHFNAARDEEALETFRKKLNLPEKFVLFLGNTDPKKNLPNVMKALGILHRRGDMDFKLVMPDFGAKSLFGLLSKQGNADLMEKIHLTGYIPNRELPNLYKLSSLFLYPSLRESFGIPILEAMACGTPVITSNTSAMPEVAGKGALFVDPSSPGSIADMIGALLKDDRLQQQAITYGTGRAKLFSWTKTASEVYDTYRTVLNK